MHNLQTLLFLAVLISSLSCQVSSRPRHVMCSLTFDLWAGFWSSGIGMSVAAFTATDSSAELVASAKAWNNLASSETNDFLLSHRGPWRDSSSSAQLQHKQHWECQWTSVESCSPQVNKHRVCHGSKLRMQWFIFRGAQVWVSLRNGCHRAWWWWEQ